MILAPCKGCNKKIIYGFTAFGRKIPVDPKTPVYALVEVQGRTELIETDLAMAKYTCPIENAVA